MAKSAKLFYCFVADNALLLDDKLNSNHKSMSFDKKRFEHAQTPTFLLPYPILQFQSLILIITMVKPLFQTENIFAHSFKLFLYPI
jgi:hypothetical protein